MTDPTASAALIPVTARTVRSALRAARRAVLAQRSPVWAARCALVEVSPEMGSTPSRSSATSSR